MANLKLFNIVYRAEVKRVATVMAKDEAHARRKFDNGDFDDEQEIYCYDIDDVNIMEDKD